MIDDSSIPLMPHAVCWRQDPQLVWTMVVTNAITFLAYLTICLTLFYLVRHTRRVIARDWAWFAVGFALFIVACGSTHLMDVITTWLPYFWVDAWTSILTAILSATVAILLIRRVGTISFSINDYAARLARTESEKSSMSESLLSSRKLEDWSRMSTAVVHEINNPLETIQNLLYLIRSSEGVSNEVIELATSASDEADRVVTISRSTLTFFRQTSTPEAVDLKFAAESVRLVLGTLLHKHDVLFEIHTEGDVTVQARPGEPRQVLLNLVRNAVEATTQNGTTIDLHLVGTLDAVEVTLTDQGSGIPPSVLATLFDFGASTKGAAGNGMGLWSVRHILKRHGGTITVESTLGKGTSFKLHWPRESKPQGE